MNTVNCVGQRSSSAWKCGWTWAEATSFSPGWTGRGSRTGACSTPWSKPFARSVRYLLPGCGIILTWLDGERITDRSLLNTMEQAIRQVSSCYLCAGSAWIRWFLGIQVSITECRPTPPLPLREGRQVEINWARKLPLSSPLGRRAILPNHIKFRTYSALAPMWTPPINESAELTSGGPLVK